MTSSPHGPYELGLHTCYNGSIQYDSNEGDLEPIAKLATSVRIGALQLGCMKPESLVIVDQHATVNMYLSLVLPARHTLGVVCSGSILDIFIFYLYFESIELM